MAGVTFGSCSIGEPPRCPDPDGVAHSSIMPWDSFLGRSARPGRSQAYGGSLHVYGTPPHPPGTVPHHGGSVVSWYGGGPHFPLIQEVGGRIASLNGYGGNFGEAPPPPIPPVIFDQPPPAPMGHSVYPSALASVVPSLGGASTLMHSLAHVAGQVSLDSNITMSAPIPAPLLVVSVPVLWAPTAAVLAHPMVVPGLILVAPAAVAVPAPMVHAPVGLPAPHAVPFQALPAVSLGLSPAPALPLVATSQSLMVDAFKLL